MVKRPPAEHKAQKCQPQTKIHRQFKHQHILELIAKNYKLFVEGFTLRQTFYILSQLQVSILNKLFGKWWKNVSIIYQIIHENVHINASNYVGFGGMQREKSQTRSDNVKLLLEKILAPRAYASICQSFNTAFFTPPQAITFCWNLLEDKFGFKGGKILEPSCGIGSFLQLVSR